MMLSSSLEMTKVFGWSLVWRFVNDKLIYALGKARLVHDWTSVAVLEYQYERSVAVEKAGMSSGRPRTIHLQLQMRR